MFLFFLEGSCLNLFKMEDGINLLQHFSKSYIYSCEDYISFFSMLELFELFNNETFKHLPFELLFIFFFVM